MNPQHLKVKEKNISLTKKYCITISIQKVSSIHKFIHKIKQILGSHELEVMSIFEHAHTKIFNHLLICMNLYERAKNQLILSVRS